MNPPDENYKSNLVWLTNNSHVQLPSSLPSDKILTCSSENEFLHNLSALKDFTQLKFQRNGKQKPLPAIYHCLREGYYEGLIQTLKLNCLFDSNLPPLLYFCSQSWDHFDEPQKIVKTLVEHSDVDVNVKDESGATALELILEKENPFGFQPCYWESIYYLIAHGSNLLLKDKEGTPLFKKIALDRACPITSQQYLLIHRRLEECHKLQLADAVNDKIKENFAPGFTPLIKQNRTEVANVEPKLGKRLIIDLLRERMNVCKLYENVTCASEQEFLYHLSNLPKPIISYTFEGETPIKFCLHKSYNEGLIQLLKRMKQENPTQPPFEKGLIEYTLKHRLNDIHLPVILEALISTGIDLKRGDKNQPTAIELILRQPLTPPLCKVLLILIRAGSEIQKKYSDNLTPTLLLKEQNCFLKALNDTEQKEILNAFLPNTLDALHIIVSHLLSRTENLGKVLEETKQIRDRQLRFSNQLQKAKISSPLSENLIPTQFYIKQKRTKFPKGKAVQMPDDVLSPTQEGIKKGIEDYLKTRFKGNLDYKLVEIIDILNGQLEISECHLGPENGREYLMLVKLLEQTVAEYNRKNRHERPVVPQPIDYLNTTVHRDLVFLYIRQAREPYHLRNHYDRFVFPCSSLLLRTEILRVCSPHMTTAEAFTKTLDPRKIRDRAYLQNPYNWIPERTGMHLKIISNQIIQIAHKARLQNKDHVIFNAVRGGTAVGKSFALINDPHFAGNPESRIELGADILKWEVQKIQEIFKLIPIVNNQAHDEGIVLYNRFRDPIIQKTDRVSFSIEGRFTTVEEVETNILEPARKKKAKVALIDIHPISLGDVFKRVLARDPYGKEPCPPLKAIIHAHKEAIQYRKSLIELVKKDPTIQVYRLYWDNGGQRSLIAEKKDGRFINHKFLNLWPYSLCLNQQWEFIFEQDLHRVITEEAIEWILKRDQISPEAKYALYGWVGLPIGKAIDYHSHGTRVGLAEELWKKEQNHLLRYQPFTPQTYSNFWIREFPRLVEHIQAEHTLHIRGVDDKGTGLHFKTGTFSSKLNPAYNSENRIHMPLGYFVIPPKHADIFQLKTLSPAVKQELEVWEGDVFKGYKLFVHPEAQEHYSNLFDSGFQFVPPVFSRYWGTPSSSYRTWIIRKGAICGAPWLDYFPEWLCIKNLPNPPFIIKFGVASSPSDVTRLLPRTDIVKSIQTQNKLNGINLGSLELFKENFGMSLKGITNYPPKAANLDGVLIDSGMIVREFPEAMMEGSSKIYSLSSVMSVERLKEDKLPLIFEIIEESIEKGWVRNTVEFVQKILIDGFLKAIENIHFKEGMAFSPHGQNLCLVIKKDGIGFAYRDLEGVSSDPRNGFLETYSWFWRYHILIKLLNVLTNSEEEFVAPPFGAPTQLNCLEKPLERNLQKFMKEKFPYGVYTLNRLSISKAEAETLLMYSDKAYRKMFRQYFDLSLEKLIPSAEKGSSGEAELYRSNELILKYKKTNLVQKKS